MKIVLFISAFLLLTASQSFADDDALISTADIIFTLSFGG